MFLGKEQPLEDGVEVTLDRPNEVSGQQQGSQGPEKTEDPVGSGFLAQKEVEAKDQGKQKTYRQGFADEL